MKKELQGANRSSSASASPFVEAEFAPAATRRTAIAIEVNKKPTRNEHYGFSDTKPAFKTKILESGAPFAEQSQNESLESKKVLDRERQLTCVSRR